MPPRLRGGTHGTSAGSSAPAAAVRLTPPGLQHSGRAAFRALALLTLARAHRGRALMQRQLQLLGRAGVVVEVADGAPLDPTAGGLLDRADLWRLFRREEREGITGGLGARRAANA